MQSQIDARIESTAERFKSVPENLRLLIAVAGIPGSGKTTFSKLVAEGLNKKFGDEVATQVPMDGYHLTRAQLSAMPNPEEAHFRRGAHWTFSPQLLSKLVRTCKTPIPTSDAQTIYAASFDHAVKDPVEDDIPIKPNHRILIFEGNYLALSEPKEWAEVAGLFDERWFVDVDEDVARERLARRHVAAGICKSYEEGLERAEKNDLVNGRFVMEHMVPVQHRIKSVDDVEFSKAS